MLNRIFKICAIVAVFFSIALVWTGDRRDVGQLELADYGHAFYHAGHLVRNGGIRELYPKADASTIEKTAANDYAHKIFGYKGPYLATFLYPAIFAVIVSPLTLLDIRTSLIVFQTLSFFFI